MRITFVLPLLPLAGGVKAVLQFSNRLVSRGHSVNVIFPAQHPTASYKEWFGLKSYGRIIRHELARRRRGRRVDWFALRAEVGLREVHDLRERFVPDADVVVATGWSTASWVNNYGPSKGKKFYLIQGYEEWDGSKEQVDATWTMPLRKIVISLWLKDLAERQFGQTVEAIISPGVDLQEFHNEVKTYNMPRRIGMMHHTSEWKGIADGVRAFEIARERHPDIKLVMFGTDMPRADLPDYVEYHRRPVGEELRQLYCGLDIFVSPSWSEGWGLPAMEAMACRCVVVATYVGGVPEYTVPGETALVAPPHRPDLLAERILELLDDENKLKRISAAGFVKMREFTWESAPTKLEATFERVLRRAER